MEHKDIEIGAIVTDASPGALARPASNLNLNGGASGTPKNASKVRNVAVASPVSTSLKASAAGGAVGLNDVVVRSLSSEQMVLDTITVDNVARVAQNSALPVVEVLRELDVDVINGLKTAEVQRRLTRFGPNALEAEKRITLLELFLVQFANMIIVLLIIAAIVSIALGEWVEGVAIIIIVFINATVATVTERSSNKALEALAKLSNPHAVAVRDGQVVTVLTSELVPGDIVVLRSGDVVPADMRVLESKELKVNEMVLTGESEDVAKSHVIPSSDADHEKLTPKNMVFSSTTTVEGSCKAVVLLTGMRTRVGAIAALLKRAGGPGGLDAAGPGAGGAGRVRLQGDGDGDADADDAADHDHSSPFTRLWRRLQAWIKSLHPKRTPLQTKLHHLGMLMASVAIIGALLVLVVGLARDLRDPSHPNNPPWLQFLMLAVSVAVSAIPEGLPLVVTICLALGTTSMAKHNALIRKLPAVETLGSASVICTDKTGTLTMGKMTAVAAWCNGEPFKVTGQGLSPEGMFIHNTRRVVPGGDHTTSLMMTCVAAGACNNAVVSYDPATHLWKAIGSATEAALVVASAKFGLHRQQLDALLPREDEIPFNSNRKMMTTLHSVQADAEVDLPNGDQARVATDQLCKELRSHLRPHQRLILSKGAPNMLLERCTHSMDATGAIQPITPATTAAVMTAVDTLSSQGLRVLAFAFRPAGEADILPSEHPSDLKHAAWCQRLVFSGLLGLMDPPREGVPQSVSTARSAGIRTVMITGDYIKTAVAIAKMVGIMAVTADPADAAVDCSTLRPDGLYISDIDMDAVTKRAVVFARARPEDKIRVVASFQRQGFVCAMTGDGVNDAPALREADIGVAMGLAGSEVAKGAADMILTDDDFNSIVGAVKQGRTIYANIQKFVMYLIGTNWSQLLVVFVCVVAGLPAPLEPLQILFINLVTDGMPAVAISIEDPEEDIMRMPPRKKKRPIITRPLAINIGVHAAVLSSLMVLLFTVGLYWHIGKVLITDMFDSDENLITQCRRLTGSGSWEDINSTTCVEDGLRKARTMVFLTLALAENMRPLTVRNFHASIAHNITSNRALWVAIMASVGAIMFVTFVPGVQDVFSLSYIQWFAWLLVLGAVLVSVVLDEVFKSNLRAADFEQRRWNRLYSMLETVIVDIRSVRANMPDYSAVNKDAAGKDSGGANSIFNPMKAATGYGYRRMPSMAGLDKVDARSGGDTDHDDVRELTRIVSESFLHGIKDYHESKRQR